MRELLPIRYGRMLVSPFTFYRGAAAIMASDLAATPNSGIFVQACGDAHISNFGGFAAPDRGLIFGPTTSTRRSPVLGVGRQAAGRQRRDSRPRRRAPADAGAGSSRIGAGVPRGDAAFARESHLDVWYERLNASELVDRFGGRLGKKGRIVFDKPFAKARRKTSLRAVKKLTERVEGELRFRSVPPLLVPLRELFDPADAATRPPGYRSCWRDVASLEADHRYLFGTYRFVDMARKVVGVGSVGTRAWVFLLVGREGKDPLVLQAKEAQASVLEPYLGASEFENHGERVVRGQRISHAASDVFLGWQRSEGLEGKEHDFYVRQLWDWKASIDLSTISESGLHAYTRRAGGPLPAHTPARATGSRSPPTSAAARTSTGRSPASPRRTPIRTSATTSGWPSGRRRRSPRRVGV